MLYEYDATKLNEPRLYAVRPKGQLGTCGFHPYPWTVVYVKASSQESAIQKAYTKGLIE